MAKKRKPILGRAWELIGSLSIAPMAKVRRPIARKLVLFKRSKKRFKLLRHYNNSFVGEYQFSPPDTPLFLHPRPRFQKGRRLLCLLCGGNGGAPSIDDGEGGLSDEFETLSDGVGREQPTDLPDYSGDEDADSSPSSVDGRAESFIKRFYKEMRMQRQDSLMQYREMLHKSCS